MIIGLIFLLAGAFIAVSIVYDFSPNYTINRVAVHLLAVVAAGLFWAVVTFKPYLQSAY